MSNTGFLTPSGDLITIFEPYTSGTTITTGYYSTTYGKDLGSIFQAFVTGTTPAALTNYNVSGGFDLNTLFLKFGTNTTSFTFTGFTLGSTVKTAIVNNNQLILFTNTPGQPTTNLTGTCRTSIAITSASIWIVGGGGGGGIHTSSAGGGTGGFISQLTNQTINSNTNITVQVGCGGRGGYNNGITYINGATGGSSIWNTTTVAGGVGGVSSTNIGGGGSGGARSTTVNGINGTQVTTIPGIASTYFGGGGGSSGTSVFITDGGAGGLGGGGDGRGTTVYANNGQAYIGPINISYPANNKYGFGYPYTGGGAAGNYGSQFSNGFEGGSGLVLLSFPLYSIGLGLTFTTAGSTVQYPISSQYNLLYITAGSGSVTFNTSIVAFILVGGGGGGNAATQGTSSAIGPGRGGQVTIVNSPPTRAYTFTVGQGGAANTNGSNTTAVGATTYTATGGLANQSTITNISGTLIPYNNLYYGGSGGGGIGGGGGGGGNGSNIYQGGANNPGTGGSGGGISASLVGGAGGLGNTGGNGNPGANSFYGAGGGGGGRNSGSAAGGRGGSGILNTGTGGGNAGGAAFTSTQGGAGAGGNGGQNTGGGGGNGGRMAGNSNGFGYASGGAGGSGIIIVVLQK